MKFLKHLSLILLIKKLMDKIGLENEIIFLRHSKVVENNKLFGRLEANSSEIEIKKKLF